MPTDLSANFTCGLFPAGEGKWQVSKGGGANAIWSKNGHELFYETPDRQIMVVNYSVTGNSFVPGKPRLWCDERALYTGGTPNLDLAPDGKRFVVFVEPRTGEVAQGSVPVTMMLNFFDELRQRTLGK